MQACLIKDPEKRPSAEQLLQHEWLIKQVQAEAAGVPEVTFFSFLTCWIQKMHSSAEFGEMHGLLRVKARYLFDA